MAPSSRDHELVARLRPHLRKLTSAAADATPPVRSSRS